MNTFTTLRNEIIHCAKCRRLTEWRNLVAVQKTKRFRDWNYWGKPVPGFGDTDARLLIVGLAPAAHGANRTGRMFTGDESGRWLFRALWKAGFANQPDSTHRDDGLLLHDCYVTAACRCAPPLNKVLRNEILNCRPYLLRELSLLHSMRIIIGLGKIGFDSVFDAAKECGLTTLRNRPKFAHLAIIPLSTKYALIGSYHPSQQNTFTGKLTELMFDEVFRTAKSMLGKIQ